MGRKKILVKPIIKRYSKTVWKRIKLRRQDRKNRKLFEEAREAREREVFAPYKYALRVNLFIKYLYRRLVSEGKNKRSYAMIYNLFLILEVFGTGLDKPLRHFVTISKPLFSFRKQHVGKRLVYLPSFSSFWNSVNRVFFLLKRFLNNKNYYKNFKSGPKLILLFFQTMNKKGFLVEEKKKTNKLAKESRKDLRYLKFRGKKRKKFKQY